MNIFYLNRSSKQCAEWHCDEHMKMAVESCQMLSTAHRVLDGEPYIDNSGKRKIKRYKLKDEVLDSTLYQATHINNPCTIWARTNSATYYWLYWLAYWLCIEYTKRYNKVYKMFRTGLMHKLYELPSALRGGDFIEPPVCMPDKYKIEGSVISSYKNFYIQDKSRFATWSKLNNTPSWYLNKDITDCEKIDNVFKSNKSKTQIIGYTTSIGEYILS